MPINKKLTAEIKLMFDIDQDIRFQGSMNKKLVEPLRDLIGKSEMPGKTNLNFGLANFLTYTIIVANNYRIEKIIKSFGYPTSKLIGKRGMYYFFVVVKSQDYDIDLQTRCLEKCDFTPSNKATLGDRILINSGKKQIYGTHFMMNKNKSTMIPQPIEDASNVEKRRKEVGLGLMSDALKVMNDRFKMSKKS